MKKSMLFKSVVRIASATVVASLLISALAGCGGKKVSDKDELGRTVISIGNYPDQEGTERNIWDSKWKKFEEDNPDVKVEPDKWCFDLQTFYSKQAGGRLPNLFVSHFTEAKQYIETKCVKDISSVLKKRGYDNMFNPQILEIVSQDDGIYAFPTESYVLGMLVNTDMFEAAGLMEEDGTPMQPKDWDEVAEFAVKIKKATGKPGIAFPTSLNNGGWIFSCLAWSFGTDFMEQNEDGKWEATFNTPETVAALQYIKDLKWKYDVLPANILIDNEEYYKTFATGNAGMIVSSGSGTDRCAKYDMDTNSIGAIAMPAGPKRHVTLLGGNMYAVSAESTDEQADAAIRWLETTYNYKATDDFKANKKAEFEKKISENKLVGIKKFRPWSTDAESTKYENDLINEYANVNLNHVKLYNEFVENCAAEILPEEPVYAQQLYGILDECIQEILNNKNADCAALIEEANRRFQADYLDTL